MKSVDGGFAARWKDKDSTLSMTLRLVIITIAAGLILGAVYSVTAGPIAMQETQKATAARQLVLPGAGEFEQIDIGSLDADSRFEEIDEIYEGTAGGGPAGYTFAITTKGYNAGLSLTVGLDAQGRVTGVAIGSHSETPGLGANAAKPEFLGQFAGKSGELNVVKTGAVGDTDINALTGATITSRAVTGAVNLAQEFYHEYLEGGAA